MLWQLRQEMRQCHQWQTRRRLMMHQVVDAPVLQADSIVELLALRADEHADTVLYSFIERTGDPPVCLTYGQVDQKARRVAALLQEADISPGDRVLVLYPPGPEFIVAFFGCMYAGAIAVPVCPPHPSRPRLGWPKLNSICRSARPKAALASSALCQALAPGVRAERNWENVQFLDAATAAEDASALHWQPPEIAAQDLAFLQYTSGSTGDPKGVMLSHGNLLHNLELIRQAFELTPQSRGVFWLPFYHDMGLIGGVLGTLYCGMQSTFFSPQRFVQRPLQWLQMISELRAQISGGPNFAYADCVRRTTPEQRQHLDLSSWRVAFCGAEPIDPRTLAAFANTFRESGFSPSAFLPCYGLAESTLLVSCSATESVPEVRAVGAGSASGAKTQQRVSCGQPAGDQRVVIVDRQTLEPCRPHEIGEVWVAGPSVAQGYWGSPQATAEVFQAHLPNGEGPFLRTGDLGCMLDGQLFIAGRCKDTMIIAGKNYFPEDIERTVKRCSTSQPLGTIAAFSVEVDHVERVVVVAELSRALHRQVRAGQMLAADDDQVCESLMRRIRGAISESYELAVHEIALVRPASIPKTSSGKVRRAVCRSRFLTAELERVA